jgi:hypothetical protein
MVLVHILFDLCRYTDVSVGMADTEGGPGLGVSRPIFPHEVEL